MSVGEPDKMILLIGYLIPEVDRRVEVEVSSCRHLVSRQHQVLRKDIPANSPLLITFYPESTKT